jgi:L-iditol 2-dehydrogenase
MEARVAVLTAPETIEIELRPVATLGPDEVLARVEQCGICGSDLKMYAGQHPVLRPPLILGHELFGTVEATGADVAPEIEAGALVTMAVVDIGEAE